MISATIRLRHKYQMSKLYEHSINYLENDPYGRSPGFIDHHAIGVVNLARLTGENSLLPTALLVCCSLGEDIVRGFQREDRSWEQLTLDDIGLCFAARSRLIQEHIQTALHVFAPPVSKQCMDPNRCKSRLNRLLKHLSKYADALAYPDPVEITWNVCGPKWDLCEKCFAMVKSRGLEDRKHVWARLPKIFGISDPAAAPGAPD
ncbi:hypothetical protein BV20DRAFT_1047355 [Pilatotrama ljubarskyi]|nr:hypothetical protein BV20DRAFT_1047355 [Pilatotrama ljubarskyi]